MTRPSRDDNATSDESTTRVTGIVAHPALPGLQPTRERGILYMHTNVTMWPTHSALLHRRKQARAERLGAQRCSARDTMPLVTVHESKAYASYCHGGWLRRTTCSRGLRPSRVAGTNHRAGLSAGFPALAGSPSWGRPWPCGVEVDGSTTPGAAVDRLEAPPWIRTP